MSAIFLKRFLQRPFQVASIIPSSRALIRRVVEKMDLSKPRVIVEYGPGEGCHTREIVRRMHPDSQVILFELDPELAQHLDEQFRDDPRVTVLNADCATLPGVLAARGHTHCDYIVSGIPFSILDPVKKRQLLRSTFQSRRLSLPSQASERRDHSEQHQGHAVIGNQGSPPSGHPAEMTVPRIRLHFSHPYRPCLLLRPPTKDRWR